MFLFYLFFSLLSGRFCYVSLCLISFPKIALIFLEYSQGDLTFRFLFCLSSAPMSLQLNPMNPQVLFHLIYKLYYLPVSSTI